MTDTPERKTWEKDFVKEYFTPKKELIYSDFRITLISVENGRADSNYSELYTQGEEDLSVNITGVKEEYRSGVLFLTLKGNASIRHDMLENSIILAVYTCSKGYSHILRPSLAFEYQSNRSIRLDSLCNLMRAKDTSNTPVSTHQIPQSHASTDI